MTSDNPAIREPAMRPAAPGSEAKRNSVSTKPAPATSPPISAAEDSNSRCPNSAGLSMEVSSGTVSIARPLAHAMAAA